MSMGHSVWAVYGSYRRDGSVKQHKVAPGTVKRIASFARPYKKWISGFLTTIVIDALLVVATPLLLRDLIDNGVLKGDTGLVVRVSLVVALLAIGDSSMGLIGRWFSSRIGEGLIFDLRTKVYSHVLRQPLAFFTRTQTGALISRLNSDVMGAQSAFTATLSSVVSNLLTLVLVVVAMLALNWQITVASLLMLPVFLIPARWVGRKLSALTREQMNTNAAMSSEMTERLNVSGALLVKLFGRPAEEDASFSAKANRVREIGVQIAMASRVFFTALTLVASLATAMVYGIGGVLAINGSLTVGTLLALTALLGRLYGPLTALANVRVDIMTALVSFERVFEVLDLKPMIADAPDAVTISQGPTIVEFDGVEFAYPTAEQVSLASLEGVAKPESAPSGPVLKGVSFRAEAGQMVALVGPSGAGKSTIISLATRLYDVDSGSVRVGGVDVRELTQESLHDLVGVVAQDPHMFHDTIRTNLIYAKPAATEVELWAALDSAQVGELVRSLPDGLNTVVGERGYRLSGGEKQRVAIARLLLKAPSVVVLDEATAHLDSESELAVQRALDAALQGRTSLVIAHRLSTIRDADVILVVDNGHIVERGTHTELLAAEGLYSELYRTQFERQPA